MSNSINNIPQQMIIEIFLHIDNPKDLGHLEKVCKLWKTILDQNPQIWTKQLLSLNQKLFNGELENPKNALIGRFSAIRNKEEEGAKQDEDVSILRGILDGILELILFLRPS